MCGYSASRGLKTAACRTLLARSGAAGISLGSKSAGPVCFALSGGVAFNFVVFVLLFAVGSAYDKNKCWHWGDGSATCGVRTLLQHSGMQRAPDGAPPKTNLPDWRARTLS